MDAFTSLALIAALAYAAWKDLTGHRISNALTVGVFAAGMLTQSAFNGLPGLLDALAGAAVGLACLLPIYLARGMGAGDVKLMSAVGAFLGPSNALLAACLALVFGAVLAVGVVLWRNAEWSAAAPIRRSGIGRLRFPYALAIGLGAVTTLWIGGILEFLPHGLWPAGT